MRPFRKTSHAIPRMLAASLTIALLPMATAHADRATICANAERGAFTDVPTDGVHAANIDCVAAYGMTVGVGGGNYDPGGLVRRAQMASFLVNFVAVALDAPQPLPSSASGFTDIAGGTHEHNIRIADELGITSGRTPTTYAPTSHVTRGQMATFVTQALLAAGADLGQPAPDRFTDAGDTTHEANIDTLAALGVVTGIGDDLYDPYGFVTRAQMATFLANAAGLLSEQGHWAAPALPSAGPEVVLVTAVGGVDDVIEVRWDESITSTAVGADVEVMDESGTQTIARGTEVTTTDDDVIRVTLDGPLVLAEIYWLQLAAGIATDVEGRPSPEQRVAFTFTATGTGGGGGDDTGNGDVTTPSIESIVTDPAASTLVVTFDEPVLCPTAAPGVAAWSFTNNSVAESATQASGSPNVVDAPVTATTACELQYSVEGIEDGDFGTMSYTQPAVAEDRVRTTAGVPLPTVTGFRVSDGVIPTYTGLTAKSGDQTLTVRFSEPVLCLSIQASDFEVEVDGTLQPGVVSSIDCEGALDNPVLQLNAGTLAQSDVVRVTLVGSIFDESQDNAVVLGARESFAL